MSHTIIFHLTLACILVLWDIGIKCCNTGGITMKIQFEWENIVVWGCTKCLGIYDCNLYIMKLEELIVRTARSILYSHKYLVKRYTIIKG